MSQHISIKCKGVNVKQIMKKIRENVRKRRKEQKVVDIKDLKKATATPIQHYNIESDLNFVNANWDIENKTYRVFSHRKLMGPILIVGRELVHGEIRRYVDPVFWKQKEFNASNVRILNQLSREIQEIKQRLIRTSKRKRNKRS